jgi:uncharacterized protein (DUF2147 family)
MFKNIFAGSLALFIVSIAVNVRSSSLEACDRICGKWQSEKKNCVVQVFRDGDDFKAKLVWFDDSDDPGKPMESRVDYKNPDKSLRSRKLIGMNVLENLEYKSTSNSWENGMIYDAQTGKKWNSSAYLTSAGALKVTGYWHFKFIGRTMTFHRVQ